MAMARLESTLEEVITRVDRLKPNQYTDRQKTAWINKVEGMLQTDVYDRQLHYITVLDYEQDKDRVLLAPMPHSDIYDHYLMAMIDYTNGDVESYTNSMLMFNTAYNMAVKALRKDNPKHTHFRNWW